MTDANEPGISDYVRDLRKWGEYRESFPTLRVPYEERTLAQHLECLSIEDLNWQRLVLLGVHDTSAQLLVEVGFFYGVGPDDKPDAEARRYLSERLRAMYVETHHERGPEVEAFARVVGLPLAR